MQAVQPDGQRMGRNIDQRVLPPLSVVVVLVTRRRGPSLSTEIKRLVALVPQGDLHFETLQGSGWQLSCCHEEGSWVGWIHGATLIEAVRAAIKVMEPPQ